jgi:hypothetical protein
MGRPLWFEWVMLLAVGEKLAFALWHLVSTPVFFDDTMNTWAGRARCLYGGVNWSVDPGSPLFLGTMGNKHYPLGITLWRAVGAFFNQSWNDFVARADGLLFFLSVVAAVWLTVHRFSRHRGLAAAAGFVVAALPLQLWNAAAGYADIAVEAFAVASLGALLRREWLVAGMLAAATGWMKNDGVLLYMPQLFLCAGILTTGAQGDSTRERWRALGAFLAGFGTLVPWLILKARFSLGITPTQDGLSWHPEGIALVWKKVILGSTHSFFWLFVLITLVVAIRPMCGDRVGRGLLGLFGTSCGAILGVFVCTDAYAYLATGVSIHRVVLQLYGIAVVVTFYALWLCMGRGMPRAPAISRVAGVSQGPV